MYFQFPRFSIIKVVLNQNKSVSKLPSNLPRNSLGNRSMGESNIVVSAYTLYLSLTTEMLLPIEIFEGTVMSGNVLIPDRIPRQVSISVDTSLRILGCTFAMMISTACLLLFLNYHFQHKLCKKHV